MEFFIKLKLSYDSATAAISSFIQRKYIKHTLILIYWLIVLFLIYDFYNYGVATGNSVYLGFFIFIISIKLLNNYKTKKKNQTDEQLQ